MEHLKLLRDSGVGWGVVNAGIRISREDPADFILTQIEDRQFIGRLPFVSE